MVASVMTFCRDACGWETDGLLTAALDVGDDPIDTHYLGYGLPLSRHAHEVLRCLFYRSPCTTGAEDLMTLCLPDDLRCRDNLARQICTINSQAARIDPRPLVVSVNGSGYRLRDGIL
jgi:hypothetical protein